MCVPEEAGKYSLYCEAFLQCSVLLSTLKHHEETRFFTAVVEGWREMEKEGGRERAKLAEKEEQAQQIQSLKHKFIYRTCFKSINILPFTFYYLILEYKHRQKNGSNTQTKMGLTVALHYNKEPGCMLHCHAKLKLTFPCSHKD